MRLAQAGPPLDEETAGPPVAAVALTALRVWEYTVTGEEGACAAAQVEMADWLRRQTKKEQ